MFIKFPTITIGVDLSWKHQGIYGLFNILHTSLVIGCFEVILNKIHDRNIWSMAHTINTMKEASCTARTKQKGIYIYIYIYIYIQCIYIYIHNSKNLI